MSGIELIASQMSHWGENRADDNDERILSDIIGNHRDDALSSGSSVSLAEKLEAVEDADDLLLALEEDLRTAFFEALFVETREVNQIKNSLVDGKHGILALIGNKGQGKSTVLGKILDDYRRGNWDAGGMVLEAFDVHALRAQLAGADGKRRWNLCHLIYSHFLDKYIAIDPSLSPKWRRFIAHESPVFDDYLRYRRESPDYDPQAGISYKDASTERWMEAEQRFGEIEGQERLGLLLAFLYDRLDLKIVLVLDNVDQMHPSFQVRLIQHLDALHSRQAPHRVESFAKKKLSTGYRPLQKSLVGMRIETYEKAKEKVDSSGLANPMSCLTLETRSATFFSHFFEKRMDYAARFFSAVQASSRARKALGPSRSVELAEQHYPQLLKAMVEADQRDGQLQDPLSGSILLWYNNSVRASAKSIYNLLLISMRPTAPLSWLYSDADRIAIVPTGSRSPSRRLRRSAIFRHVLWETREASPYPRTDLLLNSRQNLVGLSYLKLHVLQYLIRRSAGIQGRASATRFGELLSDFEGVGCLDDAGLEAAVRELGSSRGSDLQGLFLIDQHDDDSALKEDTLLVPLPAARFFNDHVLPSCEYIFWNALSTESYTKYLPRRKERVRGNDDVLSRLNVGDEGFRLVTASRFLRYSVIPEFSIMNDEIFRQGDEPLYTEKMDAADIPTRLGLSLVQFHARQRGGESQRVVPSIVSQEIEALSSAIDAYREEWF